MPLVIETKTTVAMKVNKIIHRQKLLFAKAFETVEFNISLFVNEGEHVTSHK